jgi:hypothetical protein
MPSRGDKYGVIYVDGDIPQLPIQLGQLLVDTSSVSPGTTNLQQCTDVDPVTYEAVGGGGGGTVDSVVAGDGIDVDATDPANPIVSVDPGTGLTVAAGDVALADTAVTPGTYYQANITVDQQGRLTAASDGLSPTGNTLATEILADSPFGYWKCDEASGNFADSSGNGRTLTAAGNITYQFAAFLPSQPTTLYARFNDTTAQAVASGSFSLAPLSGDYTIEACFVGQTYATNQTQLFAMGGAGELEAQNFQTSLRIDTNSRMSQFWESGAGSDTTPATIIEVLEGKAYHLLCVKDGTANTVTFWLNGVKVSTVAYVNEPTGGTGTVETGIGLVASVVSNAFLVSNVAFYSGSKLADARIVAHARAAGLFGL